MDRVFSPGVMWAWKRARAAAEPADICRKAPARKPLALRNFERLMRHGPKEYTWFIYRVTNPTMRELFLSPRNVLGMEEALLSVMAGDIFRRTPIRASLLLFKG